MFKLAVIVLFSSLQVLALEPRSKAALTTKQTDSQFTAELKPGFHFNEKAPNGIASSAGLIKPKELTATKISFEFTELKEATAQLYVCDDAVTFCEVHNIPLTKVEKKKKGKEKASPNTFGKSDKYGFIQDDLTGAIEKAKKQKKLLLIDFTARWCPSCRRLEQEVFADKSFNQFQKNFVFVKMDTDRFQNSILAEKFKIFGVPTVVLMTADQEVIAHILDYQPLSRFSDLLGHVIKNPKPMNVTTEALATATEEEKETLGFRNFYGGMYEKANLAWSAMKTAPKELLTSQYWDASDKFDKEKLDEKSFKELLESLLKKESDSGRSLVWRKSLIDLKGTSDSEKKKYFNEGVTLADKILATPEGPKKSLEGDLVGDLAGHEDFIVAVNRADLFSAMKSKDTEAAWKKAVTVGEASQFKPEDIGPSLRFLSVMGEAKEWQKGHDWLLKLKAANPTNEDLLRRETRFLVELGRFKEAVKIGEAALKNSYERNHFWVVEYLAKAYRGNNQPHKAKSLIEAYLKKPEIEAKTLSSTKKALVKLQSEITL